MTVAHRTGGRQLVNLAWNAFVSWFEHTVPANLSSLAANLTAMTGITKR